MQDVIGAAIGGRALDSHQVGYLFDDTDRPRLPLGFEANGAEVSLGKASAAGAASDRGGGGLQGFKQRRELARTFNQ
jgi:hypothetical protein